MGRHTLVSESLTAASAITTPSAMPLAIPGPSPVVPVLPSGAAAVLPLPVRGRIPGSRSFDAGRLAAGGGAPHGAPPHHVSPVMPPVALPTAAAAALSQGAPLFTRASNDPWASPRGGGTEGADADEDEAALIALAAAKSLGIDDDD